MSRLDTIGRAEMIEIVDLGLDGVPAKVDTGADSSSIWVSSVSEHKDGLHCVFFGPGNPHYSGKTVVIGSGYSVTRVANSFGQKELRYKIKLRIRVRDRLIKATFTLSDRSLKTYPILLGRRLLKNKFIVDVAQGQALQSTEKTKAMRLKRDMAEINRKHKEASS